MLTATEPLAGPREFHNLTMRVRAAGLLDRRLGYYWVKVALTVGAFAAGWAGFFLLGDSWATLGIAVFLGIVATQLGFLGHDAGHRQVFESRRANRMLGLGVGQRADRDELRLVGAQAQRPPRASQRNGASTPTSVSASRARATTDEPAVQLHGLMGWMDRYKAELFFPLMLLRSTGLYVSGFQDLYRRRDRSVRAESVLLLLHVAFYLTVVFWVLSPVKAIVFIAVHQAAFSLYLGCSFAPNHKGMPLMERGTEMPFARRQVLTARNLTGGRWVGFVFGGLNYQIEHHLFPTMPRPNLARAQEMVRAFCVENHLGYAEAGPISSFRQIVQGLQLA